MAQALNPVDVDVGSQVRDIRTECGYSTGQIAEYLGIPQKLYEELESGQTRFKAMQLKQLAAVMQVGVSVFFKRLRYLTNNNESIALNAVSNHPRRGRRPSAPDLADFRSHKRVDKPE